MKINLNANRKRQGIVLWVLVIVFVIFVAIVVGIAVLMIKTIEKLVPPPPPPDNVYPIPGDPYGGGITIGYGPPEESQTTSNLIVQVPGQYTLYICADSEPFPVSWTNVIYSNSWGDWDSFTNALNYFTVSNLMQMDPGAKDAPARFYNFLYAPPQ